MFLNINNKQEINVYYGNYFISLYVSVLILTEEMIEAPFFCSENQQQRLRERYD